MKKIAIVFPVFDHPDRMYLQTWRTKLRNSENGISFYSLITPNGEKINDKQYLTASSKGAVIRRFLLFNFFWPLQFVKYVLGKLGKKPIKDVIIDWAIYAPIIVEDPNIVVLTYSDLYARLKNVIEPNKMIVSFRGGDIVVSPWVDKLWNDTLMDDIYKNANQLHFVSNYLKEEGEAIGHCGDKAVVIYPGVDVNFFMRSVDKPRKYGSKIILSTTARLSWQKGFVYAFQAIRKIKDEGYDVQYNVIGAGNLYTELVYWRKFLNLENTITFLNYLLPNQVRDILDTTDIYIQPSITESICVAVMEAMAMNIPVIASNIGGIPELVLNGQTGILVPPADSEALKMAVIELIENPTKRIIMGEFARKRVVENFSLEHEVDEWMKLFNPN